MNAQFKAARVENYRVSDRSAADIRYLVIHLTANDGDTAKNNADYFARGSAGRVAHFFVDEKEIWQVGARKGCCVGTAAREGCISIRNCRNANSLASSFAAGAGRKVLFLPLRP